MDAGRIRQCPINLLLTRLKRADQRVQKIADPAADKGLYNGTSVHTSISSIYAYTILYAWGWDWLGQIHYIWRGNVGLNENSSPIIKQKTLKGFYPSRSYL